MGFRNGAYATVWEVRPTKSPKVSIARISISKKAENGYTDVFSHWVKMTTKAKEVADTIDSMTRIKIGSCDVEAKWNAEKEVCDYDFVIYECERLDGGGNAAPKNTKKAQPVRQAFNDEGDVDEEYIPF